MDAIIELLPLLFIGGYYLLTNRRKAQKRKQAAQSPLVSESGEAGSVQGPTPFETFLANLEESLAQAGGIEPEPSLEPIVPPEPEPIVPAAPVVARPITSLGSEFSGTSGAFDHDAHGFGIENPYSEESFERAPAFTEPVLQSVEFDPHRLRRKPKPASAETSWNDRLSDPAAARDAFVLRTVFGKRGGLKGDRSR